MDWIHSSTIKAIPIYIFSVFIGISGGLVWVGQGTLLIINSTKATISRNTGIFYFMFESSLVVGNTFIYIVFNGEKYIDGKFLDFYNLQVTNNTAPIIGDQCTILKTEFR